MKGQELLDWLEREMLGGQLHSAPNGHAKSAPAGARDDETILAKARVAKNAAKFEALFERGDISDYGGDDSRADLALMSMLGFWTQDPVQLERTAPVMYADWELNPQVQGRRAYHIARARDHDTPPPGLRYMSTYGLPPRARRDFAARMLEECINHKSKVCFIDSVGLAVSGNPGEFEVVIEFCGEVVDAFVGEGITPVLIDHQRRLIGGERNQSLGAYGSVWKENLARTQLQIELVSRDRKAHTVTTRLRPKKTNFDELPEPLEVLTTFSENTIKLEATTTDDVDRASEETLNADERVFAAIRAAGEEGAGPGELTETCMTLKKNTVQNAISRLRRQGKVENTGAFEGRAYKVRAVSLSFHYIGGSESRGEADAKGELDPDGMYDGGRGSDEDMLEF